MSDQKAVGRPRSAEVDEKLKRAALKLVRERGYRDVSISALIAEAGVSRQSLYNRWHSKADLVLEALTDDTEGLVQLPDPARAGSAQAALRDFLHGIFRHLALDGTTLRSLIAAAQEDPAFREALRTRFVEPREEIVTALLARAQSAGELPAGRDIRMLSAFIHGAFWYRLLNGLPLDEDTARDIAAAIFAP
ncbi:TetR/AcrR family transcriptional regulator [Pseudooceanicola sp. CBS1P-1]|uniref:TetR family transcriptional regulator n=1 Tax=Pseudooceanicola albus TaxID=2692189 RepID=A0A6L7GCD7_9RHOB|nr:MULTISPECIES: TetR/AcrR family transcriptional regulator [Pseudooceanicola]MBT9386688.1 TetR/AcrR family transcriptional regulator [Pseudooceanicola endophyticus]MXN20900.1 TetR family transcriptional regulator [Pseudooceanicola albus]